MEDLAQVRCVVCCVSVGVFVTRFLSAPSVGRTTGTDICSSVFPKPAIEDYLFYHYASLFAIRVGHVLPIRIFTCDLFVVPIVIRINEMER